MISLQAVVSIIVFLLIAAGVFALPGEMAGLFVSAAKIVLAIAAVLLLIGLLLSFSGYGPMFVR